MWLYRQESIKAIYHPSRFGGHRHCGSGDMILVCHVILQDHVIKGLGIIQKVRSLRRGGRDMGGASMFVRSLLEKTMLRFSKWSFIVILQFFLLIITVVWNIKQTIMRDYVQSCQWMAYDRFRQSTQDHHNVGYVKNIYLQPLVVGWISM